MLAQSHRIKGGTTDEQSFLCERGSSDGANVDLFKVKICEVHKKLNQTMTEREEKTKKSPSTEYLVIEDYGWIMLQIANFLPLLNTNHVHGLSIVFCFLLLFYSVALLTLSCAAVKPYII